MALVNKVKYADVRLVLGHRYQVHEEIPGSVETYTLAGKAIERILAEARQVCNLLALAYGYRLIELVADYVKDKEGRYWLNNVRSFVLEEHNYELKVREHEHLIENQSVILNLLREEANDSSKFHLY